MNLSACEIGQSHRQNLSRKRSATMPRPGTDQRRIVHRWPRLSQFDELQIEAPET